jgi:hypothetical protein
MVGAQISINPLWLDEYNKDRKVKINYNDVKDLTLVIPKNKAPGALFDKFNNKPIDIALQSGHPVRITGYPNAIQDSIIMRMGEGGKIFMEGNVMAVGPDGKWRYDIPIANAHIDPGASPQMIYDYITEVFLPNLQQGNTVTWNDPSNPYRTKGEKMITADDILRQYQQHLQGDNEDDE